MINYLHIIHNNQIYTSLELKTHINYFNIKNSHWEPLLEPWGFKVSVDYDPNSKPTTLGIHSAAPLNVNVTHTFLESTMSSLKLLTEQKVSLIFAWFLATDKYTYHGEL